MAIYTFEKGQNDAADSTRIPEGFAALLENLVPDGNGKLVPVPTIAPLADTIFTSDIIRLVAWHCANRYIYTGLSYSYDSDYYIALKDEGASQGSLWLFYKTAATTWAEVAISTPFIDIDSFRYACDATQFLLVGGYLLTAVQRIIIDTDGVLTINSIGVPGGGLIGEIISGTVSGEDTSDNGMAIPAGVLIQVVHADLNEFGELSTPYPIISIPVSTGLYEGDLNVLNEYVRTGILGGAFISLQLNLPVNPLAVKKYVYFRYNPYSQGITPATPFLLGGIFDVPYGNDEMTVSLGRPASDIEVSYNNTVGGSANDVIVANGTAVYGNISTEINFPVSYTKVNEIRLSNMNDSNYTNQKFKIDLVDDGYAPTDDATNFLADIDWETEDIADFRLVFGDKITPLMFHYYPLDADYTYHKKDGSAETVATRRLIVVQIPYVPAYTDTSIFLVKGSWTGTDWENYGGVEIDPTADASIDAIDFYNLSNPGSIDTVICYNNYTNVIVPVSGVQNLASHNFSPVSNSIVPWYGTGHLLFIYNGAFNKNAKILSHLLPAYSSAFPQFDIVTWASASFQQTAKGTASFWWYCEKAVTDFSLVSTRHANGNRQIGVWCYITETGGFYKFEFMLYGNANYVAYIPSITEDSNNTLSGNFFILWSWKSERTGSGADDGSTDINLTIIAHKSASNTGSMCDVIHISATLPNVTFVNTQADGFEYSMYGNFSQLTVEQNKWIEESDKYWMARILAIAQMLPDFSVEPIGVSDAETDMDVGGYVVNKNVTFDAVTVNEVNKNGYIKFGENDIHMLNEVYLNEEILRLGYLMSESNQGYQNSVFAFGNATGNVYLITVSPDQASWQKLVFLQNCGLVNPEAFVQFEDKIMWLSSTGIMMIDRNGFHDFSLGRIRPLAFNRLSWNPLNKTVYMIKNDRLPRGSSWIGSSGGDMTNGEPKPYAKVIVIP